MSRNETHGQGCSCPECDPDFRRTETKKLEIDGDLVTFTRNPVIIGKPPSEYPRSSLVTG